MSSNFSEFPSSRRKLLQITGAAVGIGAFGALDPIGILGKPAIGQVNALKEHAVVKLAWGQTAVCQSPISVALKRGFFEQYNLTVEPINFSGPTDQLLQAIATGHADGGIGMALRWLKPLEQGFDVALTVGTHGGCMRLLAAPGANISKIEDLRGKKVAVTDAASPVRNFFAIRLAEIGIDPDKEVEWLQYPQDLFGEALKKGEVDALAGDDPHLYLIREREKLTEIANNLEGPYAASTCCVLGLRGSLVRDQPDVASAITRAIVDAQAWTAANPDEAAEIFAPFVPANVPAATLATILRSHTHGHHSTGEALRRDVAFFTNKLKTINVIRQNTDAEAFAKKIVPDVLI
ncbi:ABC transporter substrate-binding protein [Aliirhizobium smilacinae]|uniref:ABC transporter substrate-binding protein n=1 Tax=Aliirhizobium smilacinae TaxID=1395944 RepID=A0A5C4XDU5_9HYPH|nr:ABC transporter substrate-binding protein [Rhizobium smilacinae]TNM61655.1 ABC transporter substrate-binding protein [Rhizobium smilacinae]